MDTTETAITFAPENWFELYYRLGWTWTKGDRMMGCPDRIRLRGSEYRRGATLVFRGTDLVRVEQ